MGTCPAVLPNDCVVDGFPGRPVPKEDGLPLVRDPDSGEVLGANPGIVEGLPCDGQLGLPDFPGVMLYPSGLGEVLGEFLLCRPTTFHVPVKNNCAGTGRALVEGKDHGRGIK